MSDQPTSIATKEKPKETSITFTPEEVKKRAYQLLNEQKILFTVETRIEAESPTLARVSHIVISSKAQDHMVDFLLDVSTSLIGNIVVDEDKLPHPLLLSDFVEWINKQ